MITILIGALAQFTPPPPMKKDDNNQVVRAVTSTQSASIRCTDGTQIDVKVSSGSLVSAVRNGKDLTSVVSSTPKNVIDSMALECREQGQYLRLRSADGREVAHLLLGTSGSGQGLRQSK